MANTNCSLLPERRHPLQPAKSASTLTACSSWADAARRAFQTGNGPIRLNGRWYVREAA